MREIKGLVQYRNKAGSPNRLAVKRTQKVADYERSTPS